MKILHLYHDLMNLYGDYANITALRKIAESNSEQVDIDRLSVGDEVSFGDYDFVYIGSGTERNMKVALEDMRRLYGGFEEYVRSGGAALLTGNSFEMLGKSVTDRDGRVYEGLGMFAFSVTEQDKTRLVGDSVYECDFLDRPLVGFVNKCSEIRGVSEPMFSVRMGLTNADGEAGEGVRLNNLFCTHLTGPALVKNPHLLRYVAGLILDREIDDSAMVYEKRGYEVTLKELTAQIK